MFILEAINEEKLGLFKIPLSTLESKSGLLGLQAIMRDIIVSSCSIKDNYYEYVAYSNHFDALGENETIPEYVFEITETEPETGFCKVVKATKR